MVLGAVESIDGIIETFKFILFSFSALPEQDTSKAGNNKKLTRNKGNINRLLLAPFLSLILTNCIYRSPLTNKPILTESWQQGCDFCLTKGNCQQWNNKNISDGQNLNEIITD
jgi:hypothetical protein